MLGQKLGAYLAMFLQDIRGNFGSLHLLSNSLVACNTPYLLNKLDHRTCLELGTGFAEFLKGNKPRIRVAKNTVTISEEYAEEVGQEDKTPGTYPGTT